MMLGLSVRADRSRAFMKIKLDRIISIATLVASLVAIVLVLKKPAPVAQPQTPAAIAANAQSFGQKMEQFEQAAQQAPTAIQRKLCGSAVAESADRSFRVRKPKAEVHLNSDEVGAALAQALGAAGAGELSAGFQSGRVERRPSKISRSASTAMWSTGSF